jgi:hypothetical protein
VALTIIAVFVAIFVAAALFVGPEVALARARVLGRWAWGIIRLAAGVAFVVAFIGFVVWEIVTFLQVSRDPDLAARDPSALVAVALPFLFVIGYCAKYLITLMRRRAVK